MMSASIPTHTYRRVAGTALLGRRLRCRQTGLVGTVMDVRPDWVKVLYTRRGRGKTRVLTYEQARRGWTVVN